MLLNGIPLFYYLCFYLIHFIAAQPNNEEKQVAIENGVNLNKLNNTVVAQIQDHQFVNRKQESIQNPDISVEKKFQAKRRQKNRRKTSRKRKQKNLAKQDKNAQIVNVTETTVSTNLTAPIHKRKKLNNKRKRKKKRNQNNILEVITNGKILPNKTLTINNDSTLINLIERLNTNPEGNFNNIHINDVEKGTFNVTKFPKRRNRCAKNNGGCSQICKRKGKNKCSCLRGYILAKNRKKCVDIDECKFRNGHCKETCRNTLGSYYCDCTAGFRISDDSKSCQDINECHLRNGHGPCQDTCTNTYGSYICDCSHLNGTRLSSDKHSCQDINECEEGTSGCSHVCINTNVGAFCSCPDGMELMSDYKTCQDIDECENATIKLSCKEGCINTIGSYYCEENFQKDQSPRRSKVPVCPPLEPPQHGFITCARYKSSPYDTFSKSGRKIIKNSPGTKCRLMCPTGFSLVGGSRFVCGLSGEWLVKRKGFCTKAPYPKLECPTNQTVHLEDGRDVVTVSFPAPRANVRWKIGEWYPEWAKNLKGELKEGLHTIQFAVTDPSTKLSSACSFFIEVKK